MKQTTLHLFTLLILALTTLSATAHDFEADGIYYNINGTEATVTYRGTSGSQYNNEYTGDVSIPESVTYGGTTYSVTAIGSEAFSYCSGLTSITIPYSVTSINEVAFGFCGGLTNITIPNSVTAIGRGPFYGCSGLTSISVENGNPNFDSRNNCNAIIETASNTLISGCMNTIIPNSVTAIGDYAFSYCSSLTNITIPNSVTHIDEGAFEVCTGLTSITIPNSVISIGAYAFGGCTSLTSISIPNSVTHIDEEALYGCSGLISISIPNSVTYIGGRAFSGCSGLTSVTCLAITPPTIYSYAFESSVTNQATLYVPRESRTAYQAANNWKDFSRIDDIVFEKDGIWYSALTDSTAMVIQKPGEENYYQGDVAIPETTTYVGTTYSVTSIGDGTFAYCSNLTSITIPNSITFIGCAAFYDCSCLTSITIPNSVIYIDNDAFHGCSGLTSISVESGNPNYDSRSNCNAIIGTATNCLFVGCMNTIIPNSVTYIGSGAFSGCSGLTCITIPNSVISIDGRAFYGCSGLTSITIPNSVIHIDGEAFEGCNGLTSITIPNSVTTIGYNAFFDCNNLTNVTCFAITPPTLNDDAFPGEVTSQATLHVPRESITAYQSADNWKDFSKIDDIVFEKDGIWYSALTDSTAMVIQKPGEENYYQGDVAIPEIITYAGTSYSVTDIGYGAFALCSGLTSITIPNSVISIGYAAFYGCSGLTNISIPNSVISIEFGAFDSCSGLTSITIPNSVTSIGYLAFESCSGLTSMRVENGNPVFDSRNNCNAIIETATNKLIAGCMNTIIPNSVTAIGIDAFYGCTGLASISIPDSVTSIEGEAFGGCSSLTSITIPNSVTYIEERAFSCCTGLTCVTCLAFMPPTINSYESYGAFPSNVTSQATLYVPRESLTAYQTANNWKDFSKIVGIPEINDFEVDGVWYQAVDENTVTVIQKPGEGDLYQGDVVIPNSVSSQGYTFSVTAIDASAFEDCYELTSVVIGDAVETIGENAFQGCTELTSVTIGSGVRAIGAKAFNYCNALTTVTCRGTVPPVMANANCFSNAAYSRATLVVPRLQIEAYQAADYWYRFSNIEGWGSAGMGDVNADGTIGISDVTALTNALLTNSTDPALLEYGDLNHNGRLDIGDVTNLIVTLLTH